MENAETSKGKLQGFISKIEDWHRMMNFLEVMGIRFVLKYDCHFYHVYTGYYLIRKYIKVNIISQNLQATIFNKIFKRDFASQNYMHKYYLIMFIDICQQLLNVSYTDVFNTFVRAFQWSTKIEFQSPCYTEIQSSQLFVSC